MATELMVRQEHYVAPNSKLAKQEHELAIVVDSWGEDFFRIGTKLTEIKEAGHWKTEAGYSDFNDYCDNRQPCGFTSRHAKRLIASARVRLLLPNLPSKGEGPTGSCTWTERSVRPLTSDDFTPSDIRRIGKKILTQVKKHGKLTSTIVKQICDEERGVERKTRKKKAKAFRDASLDRNLERVIEIVQQLRVDLDMYDQDAWDEVGETNPHLVKSLIRELDLFASFLKE